MEFDFDTVKIGALTQGQQMVHELPEVLEFGTVLTVKADNAQACGGPPEVAPAPGEHASLHGRLRWEEGEQVVEDAVGEVADAVGVAHWRRTTALLPSSHSVEQVAGVVGAARQQKVKRGWRESGGRDRCMSSCADASPLVSRDCLQIRVDATPLL
jgi:hypothetical protein